ncbi:hypothetical protein ACS15_4442 [Ralstonia insidiosa]|uniref:Uncharacterized protein n=1 Tax=Ralstonia insidiosa TaxID=190721 RepID=A0AAC9BLH2_9RALS|nr:hypothetical protein ACS15_4442 [Ralstonia insidiosa]
MPRRFESAVKAVMETTNRQGANPGGHICVAAKPPQIKG